jgi:RecB family exonuclease
MEDEIDYDNIYDNLSGVGEKKTLSPSSIKKFLDCDLLYYFDYVLGWKADVKSVALSFGSSLHKTFEETNRKMALDQKVTVDELLEHFEKAWGKETSLLREGKHYKKPDDLDKQKKIAKNLVEKYWKSSIRKCTKIALHKAPNADVYVPAVEVKIEVPITNLKTGRLITDDYIIKGFIDKIDIVTKETSKFKVDDLLISDYKSASRDWSHFDVRSNLQLLIYAYAMRWILRNLDMFPYNKDKEDYVGIIGLMKNKPNDPSHRKIKPAYFKVEDSEIDFLERMIEEIVTRLSYMGDDIKNYLPRPSPDKCRYCLYKDPCLLFRGGAGMPELIEWKNKHRFLFTKREDR